MSQVDEQLSLIPSNDFDGSPIQDSLHLDMYIDSVSATHFVDGIENIIRLIKQLRQF